MTEQLYRWIKNYSKITEKLIQFKNNRPELIKLLKEMSLKVKTILPIKDKNIDDQDVELKDIDPFTFFSNFNRPIKDSNRIEIIKFISEYWSLNLEFDTDFSGLPTSNNQKAWFFDYEKFRKDDSISLLWDLFEQAYNNNISEETFNKCLNINQVNNNLSIALFWCFPDKYLPLDKKTKVYLEKKYAIDSLSSKSLRELKYDGYIKILKYIKSKSPNKKFYEISFEAENSSKDINSKNLDNKDSDNDISLVRIYPLNQILYGPPGTGKTYNTINYAVAIIENKTIESIKEEYKHLRNELIKKFNEYKSNGQIEFVTFHQNYNYEDFIQGIKPNINNTDSLSFERNDGIFFKISTESLFEYYKISKKNEFFSKRNEDKIDINQLYNDFIDNLKKSAQKEFDSSNGSKIIITDFSKNNNMQFRHENSTKTYIVSANRLLNLFKEFPEIDSIRNINSDIRSVIGGCNTTVYWVALKEFINFYNTKKTNYIQINEENNPEELYEDIDYQTKRNLLQNFDFNIKEFSYNQNEIKKYVLIIDEINRANISRVFGELITLIEEDKRYGNENQMEVTLPSGDTFTVPSNLYIIGTMNTADKSIALLDIALRRRFKFVSMYPDYSLIKDSKLQSVLKSLNREIKEKKGTDFMIGHSFFIKKTEEHLTDIVEKDLIPLLSEYFNNKVDKVIDIFKKANIQIEEDENTFQLRFKSYKNQVQNNEDN